MSALFSSPLPKRSKCVKEWKLEEKNPRTKGQKGREGRSEFKVIDLYVKVFGEFELPELNSRKNTFYGLSWYELDKWLAC